MQNVSKSMKKFIGTLTRYCSNVKESFVTKIIILLNGDGFAIAKLPWKRGSSRCDGGVVTTLKFFFGGGRQDPIGQLVSLTRTPLGYLAERAPLGGGADSAPPPRLTHERMAVARWAWLQTKALGEYL